MSKNKLIISLEPKALFDDVFDDKGRIVLRPETADIIKRIKEFTDEVNAKYKAVKNAIYNAAKERMINPTSVVGDGIIISFVPRGSEYILEDPSLAEGFYETEIKFKIKTNDVKKYIKEHGQLPPGIKVNKDRKITPSIRLK